MPKPVSLALALTTLSLAAGCLAAPAPASLSPAPDRLVSGAAPGQPDLLAAPAPVVTPTQSPASTVFLPPSFKGRGDGGVRSPGQPAPTDPPPGDAQPTLEPVEQLPLNVPLTGALPANDHPAARVPILEYHYASFDMLPTVSMRPAWFEAQIQWLSAAGFHTISSAELAGFVTGQQAMPARSVALTFDVGASHFDEYTQDIIPALRRYHLRAIFFVMPSQTRDACNGQLACWPSLLAWRDEGLISIESHSLTHQDYATLSPESLARDITRSKAAIEAKTGQPVLGLCYPFDSVAPAAFDLLAKAGYRFAVAGATRRDRSAQWNDPRPYALPRYYPYSGDGAYPLISGTGGQTFEQMLVGAISD